MGVDYSAEVDQELSSIEISELIRVLSSYSEWEILEKPEDRESLRGDNIYIFRFIDTEKRADRSEDVLLKFNGTNIYVLFTLGRYLHEGTFLKCIEDALRSMGIGISHTFEEL